MFGNLWGIQGFQGFPEPWLRNTGVDPSVLYDSKMALEFNFVINFIKQTLRNMMMTLMLNTFKCSFVQKNGVLLFLLILARLR